MEPPPTARNLRLDWGPASCFMSAIARSPPGRLLAPTYGDRGRVDQNPPMATTSTTAASDARTRGAALLVLGSIVSVQCGAALATGLFDSVGPAGAVFLRAGFGALALLLLTRGAPLRTREWPHRDVSLLSLSVAAVNLFFYAALDRLPLGITVTLEFVGPLGVAVFGSRRRRDILWALLAAVGIVLLSDGTAAGSRCARRRPGADRRRLLGRLHPPQRPGRRARTRARRRDDGGGDLGRDGGAARDRPGRHRPAGRRDARGRRRRRRPQHRDPLRRSRWRHCAACRKRSSAC